MEIEVKVASILRNKGPESLQAGWFELTLPDRARADELVTCLGIPARMVGTVLVNGRRGSFEHRLRAGDRVAILPAISGG